MVNYVQGEMERCSSSPNVMIGNWLLEDILSFNSSEDGFLMVGRNCGLRCKHINANFANKLALQPLFLWEEEAADLLYP